MSKKLESYNPETRFRASLQIHDHYVGGKFVESQAYEDPMRIYDASMIPKYLEDEGFVDISLGGSLTDAPPDESAEIVSLRCKKPAG